MFLRRFVTVLLIALVAVLSACTVNNSNTGSTASPKANQTEVKKVLDAGQYFRVTEKELISLKGNPESKENWNYKSPNGKSYKALTYTYDSGNQEFMIIDGKVVRYTYYANDQPYTTDEDIFKKFGVVPSKDMVMSGGGASIKYNSVAEKVPEVWIIKSDDTTLDTVKITYDLRYF